jgi:catechol 2,3-dioxygenase-like lactoylglutathione lyase family enzyme
MSERQRVTGIGGVFFKSRDAEALSRWYADRLGVPWKPGEGAIFRWDDPQGLTVWSAFPADTKYFDPGPAPFMINFRVKDLDALLAQLATEGVRIDPKRENHDYGRFAWIYDPDGNKIELWQPL